MAIMGPGTPLRIGQEFLWKGRDKTNGFLMRNVDGRVPALKEGYARLDIAAANVLYADGVMPYGNGLWRNFANFDKEPGVLTADGSVATSILVGIAEFNQGWQTGHPVQNWGFPTYARSDMIRGGYVGYKVCKAIGASASDYLAYLKGDRTKDVAAVGTVYSDWAGWVKAGTDGGTTPQTGRCLVVAFEKASGFPVMVLYDGTTFPAALTTVVKGGDVVITENENEAVFIDFKVSLRPGGR